MAGRRVALITGASRGIGRAVAEDRLAEGWRVGALARDGAALRHLAARAPAGRLCPLVADVTDPAAVARATDELMERFAVPDLVVANAGCLAAVGPTWDLDPDLWWRELEVNVLGVLLTVRAALPRMVARGRGRIVIMSSGLGRKPSPWSSAYGASKAAVAHLASSLAIELEGSGVAVFAISPGMVRTDMTQWPEALVAHRPELATLPEGAYLPVSEAVRLVADLAGGRFDALSGRFIHARDDREALLAEAVAQQS